MFDYMKQVGGPGMAEKAWKSFQGDTSGGWYRKTPEQRRLQRDTAGVLGGSAENTLDRATAMLPKLMYERLPDMGIDYAVIYPTIGFLLPEIKDPEIRHAACRAHNLMMKDLYAGLEDRLTPAAVIPCYTPQEAIEELEFAITTLKLKVPMFSNLVKRPIGAVVERGAELGRYAFWVDTLALDSAYDYDPVWHKCMDLKVPVTAHAIGQGIGMRRSISNYMYNHTGHFAAAGHAFAKSLFFGGVTDAFGSQFRLPRRRHRLGRQPGLRPEGTLGKAQRQRHPAPEPREDRRAAARRTVRRYGNDVLAGKFDPKSCARPSEPTRSTISPPPASAAWTISSIAACPTSTTAARPTTG